MKSPLPLTTSSLVVSRRDLLARSGSLALLALGGGVPALLSGCAASQGSPAQASDPELARMVDAVIGVDMHSHSGGVHFRSAPSVNLAERRRQGRMSAVCLCHTGDGPVMRRRPDNHIITVLKPRAGRALAPHPGRLISREHATVIAQTGGVVGVWGIAPTFETLPGLARDPVPNYLLGN